METFLILALSFALAFLAESLTEYLFGALFDHIEQIYKLRWTLMYIAAAAGVGLAFWYRLDIPALIIQGEITWVGELLTGLAIGRGANYLHQFVSEYFPAKQ